MIKIILLLLPVVYGLVMYRFSSWRTARELDARSTELADPILLHMSRQMADVLELDRLPVYIYEVAPINGLAAPDGRIFITRGFFDRYRQGQVSAAEMASVIAHELGHVALGHSRRRMIDFSGQNAVRMILSAVLNRFLPGLGVWIANTMTSVLMARLSQRDEFEADAYASALLTKAGIGTAPQKQLFEKLDKLTGHNSASMPAWFMSHPKATARIEAIEKLEAKWSTA